MSTPIEDYAIIGDTRTVAAVAAQRLDRLVVRPPHRFRCGVRRAAGRTEARAVARSRRGTRSPRPAVGTPATRWSSRPSSRRATAR